MKKNYYFIGIYGLSMRMLALQMKEQEVYGTDLRLLNIPGIDASKVFLQDGKVNLPEDIDTVVFTTDIPQDHPDLLEAQRRGLRIMHRLELKDELLKGKESIVITGSSGKTSSTYYTYSLLKELGMKPFAFIGAFLGNGQTHIDGDTPYIMELTESDLSHTKLKQPVGVLLNYSLDHFWNYASTRPEAHEIYKKEYRKFIDNSDLLIYNGDDEILKEICGDRVNSKSYGYEEQNDLRISDAREDMWHIEFKINSTSFKCNLHGLYSVYNVAAAAAVAHFKYNFSLEQISDAARKLEHAHRRMTRLYEDENLTIIDDHATFVDEFQALLKSLEKFNKEISIVYESPRMARFSNFRDEFLEVLRPHRTAVRQKEVFEGLVGHMDVTLIDDEEKIDKFFRETKGIAVLCYFADTTRPYYLKWIENNNHRNRVVAQQ